MKAFRLFTSLVPILLLSLFSPGSKIYLAEKAAETPTGQIAYILNGNIWLINANGTNPRQITSGGGYSEPVWSRNAKELAFVHEFIVQASQEQAWEIGVLNLDSLEEEIVVPAQLTPFVLIGNYYRYFNPRWSSDNNNLYYISADGRVQGYYVHKVNVSTLQQDLNFSPFRAWAIDVSPTDGRIAYTELFNAVPSGNTLNIVDATGSQKEVLVTLEDTVGLLSPAFSPDGLRIAIVRSSWYYNFSNIEILRLSDLSREVYSDIQAPYNLAWSVDGTILAYEQSSSVNFLDLVTGVSTFFTSGSDPSWGSGSLAHSKRPWTIMYYQAWDNKPEVQLGLETSGLKNASVNTNIYLPVFRDNLSKTPVYEAYVDGLRELTMQKDELNTGDPDTLVEFINWAKSEYPAEHFALVIVDHGHGMSGTAQDYTSKGDWINPQELRTALQTAGPLDVIYLEACLVANIEYAYQARGLTDYYVASESVSKAPRNHGIYLDEISAGTDARTLAISMAKAYDSEYNKLDSPSTISVGDMSKIELVAQNTNDLASAIRSHKLDLGIAIWEIVTGDTVQRFEENGDKIINAKDSLADLYHFTQLIGWLAEPDLTAAANDLTAAIDDYIIYNSAWNGKTWDHSNAHGLSILLTDVRMCYYSSGWFDFAGNVSWFCNPQTTSTANAVGEWGQMLSDLINEYSTDPQQVTEPPPLVPLDVHLHSVYLPLLRSGQF